MNKATWNIGNDRTAHGWQVGAFFIWCVTDRVWSIIHTPSDRLIPCHPVSRKQAVEVAKTLNSISGVDKAEPSAEVLVEMRRELLIKRAYADLWIPYDALQRWGVLVSTPEMGTL